MRYRNRKGWEPLIYNIYLYRYKLKIVKIVLFHLDMNRNKKITYVQIQSYKIILLFNHHHEHWAYEVLFVHLTCFFKWHIIVDFETKFFPHTSQMYGLSPVWSRLWIAIGENWVNVWPHWSQLEGGIQTTLKLIGWDFKKKISCELTHKVVLRYEISCGTLRHPSERKLFRTFHRCSSFLQCASSNVFGDRPSLKILFRIPKHNLCYMHYTAVFGNVSYFTDERLLPRMDFEVCLQVTLGNEHFITNFAGKFPIVCSCVDFLMSST